MIALDGASPRIARYPRRRGCGESVCGPAGGPILTAAAMSPRFFEI
jgi:hypothetical protein